MRQMPFDGFDDFGGDDLEYAGKLHDHPDEVRWHKFFHHLGWQVEYRGDVDNYRDFIVNGVDWEMKQPDGNAIYRALTRYVDYHAEQWQEWFIAIGSPPGSYFKAGGGRPYALYFLVKWLSKHEAQIEPYAIDSRGDCYEIRHNNITPGVCEVIDRYQRSQVTQYLNFIARNWDRRL